MAKNFELGDRVDRWLEHESTIHRTLIIGAVDHKVIRFRPLPIDGIGLVLSRRASCFEQPGRQGHHARLKQPELREVAAVQRKVENLALHHGLPETTYRALHQSRVRAHFNLLRLSAQLEVNGDGGGFVDVQRDALLQVLLETFRLNL